MDIEITYVNIRLDYVFKMHESICQHNREDLCDHFDLGKYNSLFLFQVPYLWGTLVLSFVEF